ncbi:DUF1292 domain-containing protein [Lysinibacillus sphaericus]|nr:DUF1292 domain-containing protein [Lysinibacillus sphaericus]
MKIRGDMLNLMSLIVKSDSDIEELLRVNETLIVNGQQYMVVTDPNNGTAAFVKVFTNENGEDRISDIYDDDEFQKVQNAYENQGNIKLTIRRQYFDAK